MTPPSLDAADRPMTYRQVLATRNVAQLLLSASLSRLASEMLLFAVVLYVLAEFRSPVLAGLSGFFLTLPGFLVSPVAGAVLDRVGAVRAVILDTVISALLIGLVVFASVGGGLTPVLLLTVLGLYSLTSPLSAGGIRTLFPRFVPRAAYDKANALDLSTYSVIDVVGPLVAGTLFALVGPDATLGIVAGMFAMAALSLLLLRGSGAEPERGERKHLLREAWEGITYLFGNRTLRGLAVSYSCYQVAFGILVVAVPVTVAERIGGTGPTEQVAGLLWSVVGVCGAVGALVAGKVLRAGGERALLIGATVLSAVAIFPVSAVASLVMLAVGLAFVGLLEGALNVSVLSLRQRRTEPRWLGRVMTVSISVNLIGFPIGTALGGLVVAQSTTAAFVAAAGFAVLAAAGGALVIPA
ncbi:Major Facilitator Superfamily protein [Actinokineospora alba]|uniref:Major Facilitator Superfamily protein n=1 Tax=Actinokineospora alba TaxID=504798 RepID=A0A1H0F2E6_9PSEU|nr:MFS transporter [Actinokineospora alba]TDP69313.1 MFS transporter [Actinokineospora alba]SDI19522.1 Major Facilitator Superfamily protein [Actinokineospora alba]SDN88802.1 Major Facilitator Superfamily protein [Actinokineospora alba]